MTTDDNDDGDILNVVAQRQRDEVADLTAQLKTAQDQIEWLNREAPMGPDDASSNFYWTYGREQVFHVQTTIRRALSPDDYERHIKAAISAMQIVIGLGGKAKPVGSTYAPPPSEPKAVTIAREAGGDEAADAVKEALSAVPQGEYETLDAARLVVIPQPE